MNSSSYFNAFLLVFLAGLFWSFGVVTVRYMVDAHDFVFQYLFYRGISIAIILLIVIFVATFPSFKTNLLILNQRFKIIKIYSRKNSFIISNNKIDQSKTIVIRGD